MLTGKLKNYSILTKSKTLSLELLFSVFCNCTSAQQLAFCLHNMANRMVIVADRRCGHYGETSGQSWGKRRSLRVLTGLPVNTGQNRLLPVNLVNTEQLKKIFSYMTLQYKVCVWTRELDDNMGVLRNEIEIKPLIHYYFYYTI